MDDPFDAAPKRGDVEVDEQAEAEPGGLQIGQRLQANRDLSGERDVPQCELDLDRFFVHGFEEAGADKPVYLDGGPITR